MKIFGITVTANFSAPDYDAIDSLLSEHERLCYDTEHTTEEAEESIMTRLDEIRAEMKQHGYSYDPRDGFR